MADKKPDAAMTEGHVSIPPIPIPQIEAQCQEPGESSSNAGNKSESELGERNPLVAPEKNPFKMPVILDCLKAVSGVEDLKGLRQLSILHHKSFGKAYLDKVGKTLKFLVKDPRYGNPCEFVPAISSDNVHIFRQLVLTSRRMDNVNYMDELLAPEVMVVFKPIADYLVKIEFGFQFDFDEDQKVEKLLANLNSMFHQLPELRTGLSEFVIRYCSDDTFLNAVPGLSKIIESLPQNIKTTIELKWTEVPELIEISNSYPTKMFPSRQVDFNSHLIIESELQLNQILEHRTRTNAQWHKDNNLKSSCIWIDPHRDAFNYINNGIGILNSFEKLLCTFNDNGLMKLEITERNYAQFDWLGRSLDLGNWKQNIRKLILTSYVHPLTFLHEFPNLSAIKLEMCNLNLCLLSNSNTTDEENLNQVFGGLENLKVTLSHSNGRVQPNNELALHIQTMVRQLKFDPYEIWKWNWDEGY